MSGDRLLDASLRWLQAIGRASQTIQESRKYPSRSARCSNRSNRCDHLSLVALVYGAFERDSPQSWCNGANTADQNSWRTLPSSMFFKGAIEFDYRGRRKAWWARFGSVGEHEEMR